MLAHQHGRATLVQRPDPRGDTEMTIGDPQITGLDCALQLGQQRPAERWGMAIGSSSRWMGAWPSMSSASALEAGGASCPAQQALDDPVFPQGLAAHPVLVPVVGEDLARADHMGCWAFA